MLINFYKYFVVKIYIYWFTTFASEHLRLEEKIKEPFAKIPVLNLMFFKTKWLSYFSKGSARKKKR